MNYCYNCMNQIGDNGKCEKCGYVHFDNVPPHRLKPGTILSDRYLIGNAIGEGGFGITYVGFDKRLEMKVAVKEFFPSGFVTRFVNDSATVEPSNEKSGNFFKKGKEEFLREARTIALFSNESGIVDVRDYFEDNGTAYIVMAFIEGKTLNYYMREHGVFKINAILKLIKPIIKALEKIHNVGLIHRDISPDNIMFTTTSRLQLMDFGAAINFYEESSAKGAVVLKPGYAPPEQYKRDGNQGPWTDVYALCATIYKCITGVTPYDAVIRAKKDELKRPSELGVSIPPQIENVLMRGLELDYQNRIQSATELMAELYRDEELFMNDIETDSSSIYIEDNIETSVIDENFVDACEETAFPPEEETKLLIDEEKTSTETEEDIDTPQPINYQNTVMNLKAEQSVAKIKEKNQSKRRIFIPVIIGIVVVVGIVIGILVTSSGNNNRAVKGDTINYDYSSNSDNAQEYEDDSNYVQDYGDDSDTNYESNSTDNQIPEIEIEEASSDCFTVTGATVQKKEGDGDIFPEIYYNISLDIDYSEDIHYAYHSETLYDSKGKKASWYNTDNGYLVTTGEESIGVTIDIPKGHYKYEIELINDNGDIVGSGTIKFTIN